MPANEVAAPGASNPAAEKEEPSAQGKTKWTDAEDNLLRELVSTHGTTSWVVIAAGLPNRSSKSCRLRWHNQLSPQVSKAPFSEWEQAVIVRALEASPNKWAAIARLLPGRTDNQVKNHWHATLRRKTEEGLLHNRFLQQGRSLDWLLRHPTPRPGAAPTGAGKRAAEVRASTSVEARPAKRTNMAGCNSTSPVQTGPIDLLRCIPSGHSPSYDGDINNSPVIEAAGTVGPGMGMQLPVLVPSQHILTGDGRSMFHTMRSSSAATAEVGTPSATLTGEWCRRGLPERSGSLTGAGSDHASSSACSTDPLTAPLLPAHAIPAEHVLQPPQVQGQEPEPQQLHSTSTDTSSSTAVAVPLTSVPAEQAVGSPTAGWASRLLAGTAQTMSKAADCAAQLPASHPCAARLVTTGSMRDSGLLRTWSGGSSPDAWLAAPEVACLDRSASKSSLATSGSGELSATSAAVRIGCSGWCGGLGACVPACFAAPPPQQCGGASPAACGARSMAAYGAISSASAAAATSQAVLPSLAAEAAHRDAGRPHLAPWPCAANMQLCTQPFAPLPHVAALMPQGSAAASGAAAAPSGAEDLDLEGLLLPLDVERDLWDSGLLC